MSLYLHLYFLVNKNNLNERYEMEETRERIKLLIKNLGLPTTAKFCRDTGLSRPLVDKLTSPEGNQPRFDTLQKIKSAFPETNLNWLVSGQGEALESVPDKKDVDLLNSYRNIKIKNNSNLTNSFLTSIQFISKEYQEMEEMELNAKAQFILEKELNQFRRELLFYQYQRRLVSERLNKTSDQKSILTENYNEKRKVELNRLLEELSQQISKTINLITEDVVNITEEKTQIDSSEIYYDEDLKVKE